MTVTVRFAPSPTGRIHIGNARTALFNRLFAQQRGGRFILRFDDTDAARSRREYADGIERDLGWLGIRPDAVYRQSERAAIYDAAVARLKAAGVLYPCYETAEELELRRKVLLSRKLPPVYGREALRLTDAARAELEAQGRRPHWRFLLPNFEADPFAPRRTEVTWDDLCRGPQTVDLASLSDPVLVREDGTYLYTLPSVADDIEMGVSHVIRGDDHVTNTGAQIALFRALGAEPPAFGHHNLLTSSTGEGLSKRTGALSIEGLREDGIEAMSVASLAVLIGSSEAVAVARGLDELAARFDIAAASKGAARFDPAELLVLNCALLREASFGEVADRLAALGISGPKAGPFWLAVRDNLSRLSEAAGWWGVVAKGAMGPQRLSDADVDFARAAFDLLPAEPWGASTFKAWTEAAKRETGRSGRQLFGPLRLALTGHEHGPALAELLPLMGRESVLARRP